MFFEGSEGIFFVMFFRSEGFIALSYQQVPLFVPITLVEQIHEFALQG